MAVVTQVHPNFQTALAACGEGYNAGDIADVIAYKAAIPVSNQELAPEQALNSIVAVAMAAAEIQDRPLRVLDFGGGCGFHYFRVTAALKVALRWTIVETPTMAERAAKLGAGKFEASSDVGQAVQKLGGVDLVHASSAIQYVPDPLASLRSLAELQAPFFLLARFPLWQGAPLVGVQKSTLAGNGIGPMPPHVRDREVEYPVTFSNFGEVLQVLDRYEAAVALGSPSSEYMVRGQRVPGITALFRRRQA